MQKIPLFSVLYHGESALVDDEDFERLNAYKWGVFVAANGSLYAARWDNRHGDVLMHREILGLKQGDGTRVDHRNGETLNNQRPNLRLATHAQNMRNRKRQRNNTSGFKGVYFRQQQNNFVARIKHNGKEHYLGSFPDALSAALAYDAAATERFGEFARPNFSRKEVTSQLG